jgi:hypothetical protein
MAAESLTSNTAIRQKRSSTGLSGWIAAVLSHPLISLAVISGGLGIAISYGDLYLYHVVLVVGLAMTMLSLRKIRRRTFNVCLGVITGLLIWGIAWPAFWKDPTGALKYLAVIVIGLGGSLLLYLRIRTIAALKAAVGSLFAVEILNAAFAYLEIYDIYHLPAKTRWLREVGSPNIDQMLQLPSAFNVNPNNFAVAMLIPIAFGVAWFLKRRRDFLLLIGPLPFVLYIVLRTRSRGASLGVLALFLAVAVWQRRTRLVHLIILGPISIAIIILAIQLLMKLWPNIAGDTLSLLTWEGLKKIYSITNYALKNPSMADNLYSIYGSLGDRVARIVWGIQVFWKTRGLGLGPGAKISMHNLYLETLVNGGLLGLFLLLRLFYTLIHRSLSLSRFRFSFLGAVGLGCFLFWVGYSIGVVTMSTAFYFLPMYMMLGISLAAFDLQKRQSRFQRSDENGKH